MMYFLTVKPNKRGPVATVLVFCFLFLLTLTLHCTEADAAQLRLQIEPRTGGRGTEGLYRLGLWGCTGKWLFSVFPIQPKSSKTSSSLLSAAS